MFSEVAEIALVAARLGQFQQLLKTQVILILNFTRPHAITYTNCTPLGPITITNHNCIKILEYYWSSAGLISAVIVQLHTSCACNCTVVRVMPE